MDPQLLDHSPLCVELEQQVVSSTKLFRFYNYLAEYEQFLQEVQTSWSVNRQPNKNRVKQALKKLNSAGNNGEEKRVEEAKCALKLVKEQIMIPMVNQMLQQEEENYRRNLVKWMNIQESIM
ncbi:hypothetical protein FXO38_31404 [Capsicum annuum]|uniref:Uncharacterized protein n=1 Tax=Capsicum annuum TaxID=4072 RepID=A0A2G2ZGV9_CAPAN|nr:hypothetical protein FXO37_34778 [Capsicum annuum]KAF3622210.1 hypothetical protein FXO38_31404 [Capsicum annuum]PHT81222.1 hypothetical protein T459_14237 [Capsicum annuum]